MADSVSKPSAEIVTEESSEEKLLHTKEQNDDVVQKPSKLQAKENARKKRFEKRMRFQPKSVLESVDDLKYYEELVDKKKGQRVNTPETLLAMEYACGHAEELESMLKALKQHSGNKTAMQTLPFRLRRRAASHNSKRLPQRLRDLAKKQNEKSENKVVTRRKRRRNINLQNEYARRAGKQGWLETHLWHSKRFQMSSSEAHFAEWGCRVALRSYDKTFRTSYRAVAKHCTIQDLSFFKFVEVTSPEEILLKFLKSVTLDSEWSRLSELPTSLSELECLFFDKHCEPAQCVGPVNVMLAPVCQVNDLKRTMWLWLHPVLLRKIMTLLENFKEINEIEINEVSKSLNRFRLTGPKSSVTLMSVLKSYKMNLKVDKENENSSAVKSWMSEHQELVEKQHSIFTSTMKKCHDVHFSPDEESLALPCDDGHVYCYVTNDPRLTLPLIKTPSLITAMEPTVHENVDELSRDGTSPLWNSALRSEVSSSRLPDHVVSTRKCNAKFLPEKEKKKQMNSLYFPVPVLLIYRKGKCASTSKRSVHSGPREHFGSGWDIVFPANWSMAFWVPFIYHQAKPVAMKNYLHSSLERKYPTFPRDYPDTGAGASWWKSEKEHNHSNYYKKPPSKRPNYAVLGTRFPFSPEWQYLLGSETNAENDINNSENNTENRTPTGNEVLLSDDLKTELPISNRKRPLQEINDEPVAKQPKLDERSPLPIVIRDVTELQDLSNLIQSVSADNLKLLEEFASRHLDQFVCIELAPVSKGVPAPRTMLCLPSPQDIDDLKAHFGNLLSKGLADCNGPVEPKHWDPFRKERKEATKLAKKNRKRKKENKMKIERNLPSMFDVTSCRKLVGFVTSGDFLFSYATGGGVGFITIQALVCLYRLKVNHVWLPKFLDETVHANGLLCLMKNIDSEQYRFAIIDVMNSANK